MYALSIPKPAAFQPKTSQQILQESSEEEEEEEHHRAVTG